MKTTILFGNNNEWGISEDDGCLLFHPDMIGDPDCRSTYIWKEAWEEVEFRGGYEAVIRYLRGGDTIDVYGREGFLIRIKEDEFVYREYETDYSFTDYTILHHDLRIAILDSSAVLNKATKTIDYAE